MPNESRPRLSRREAIGLLGTGTGAGLVSLLMGETNFAARQQGNAPIIRTVLEDVPLKLSAVVRRSSTSTCR